MLSTRGIITIACFVCISSGLTGFMLERSAKERAEETGSVIAQQVTAEIRTHFERPIGIAGGMNAAFAAARKQGGASRDVFNGIMASTLTANPEVIGAWVGFEPNAFDGRDSEFAGTKGHDATGRFLPYWFRSNGRPAMEPLRGYSTPGTGDWYIVPVQTGRPLMWGPSLYEVEGKKVPMASVVFPFIENGRATAALGVDLGLSQLSTKIAGMKIPFSGDVEVLSEKDLYVYAKDPSLVAQKGPRFVEGSSVVSDPDMGRVIQIVRTIKFDGFDRGWVVRVRLPVQAVLADARRVELLLFVSALVMIVGLAIVLRRLSKRLVGQPLTDLAGEMNQLAAGHLDDPQRQPAQATEIQQMRESVDVFRQSAREKRAADEAKARADAEQKLVVDVLSAKLSDMSSGDLTSFIDGDFPRDYGVLKSNFNEALERLRGLIGAVSESAMTIRTGSDEIAQASEDLARRTESNAASLEETPAAVAQMDGRLRASATAASQTVQRADQAIATVHGGRSVADEAVQAMGRVAESAKGIDTVIEGLDKIAFQTRVLAMNAAVEAGRAGEAGRGFAVVADLVSALAMRAEEEAKRARDQLTTTQTDIVKAVDAVTNVDNSLSAISGDVEQVHKLLAAMASDNQAQSTAITQISVAVGTMDQSTQQNAAMVEQTSAAARNLATEVSALSKQASLFKVSKDGSGGGAAKRAPASPVRSASAPAVLTASRMQGGSKALQDDWTAF